MTQNLLLTGSPGCGKTTLIKKVLCKYDGEAGGFYTQELSVAGTRVGFEIATLDEQRGILAHVDLPKMKSIGKYGVDLSALENIGIQAVERAIRRNWLVVIDEIGPMEIFSNKFRNLVDLAIISDARFLGTIVRRSTPFTDEIKRRPEITLIEVNANNRDHLPDRIIALLSAR